MAIDLTEERRLGKAHELRRYEDIRELLPGVDNPTPLVGVNRVMPQGGIDLYLKLEWLNPFGSIKDRTAAAMLDGLIERGELEGHDLVEPTSGNTGIALAALAALIDTKLIVTVPEAIPEEKKTLLRMLGAEVWATPDDLCPVDRPNEGAIALARAVAASATSPEGRRYVMPDQYGNPDNVRAHYETTGPEIWRQTDGKVRYFIAGFGTCGTITGVGRYLKEQDPGIEVIGVEPQPGHRLPGMKNLEEATEPEILDWSVVDHVVRVDDEAAYAATKRLYREEGLIVGPTTGAVVHAAAEFGAGRHGIAVGVSPDSGFKYASYFEQTLGDEGFPQI
jgi:cysteine synthase A/cysteine synthase B